MQKKLVTLPEIQLAGITVRTNNARCSKKDPATNDIAKNIQTWFQENFAERLLYRKQPGTTLCVYTQYESDWQGEYTHFIGEAVTQLEGLPGGTQPSCGPTPALPQNDKRPRAHARHVHCSVADHLGYVA